MCTCRVPDDYQPDVEANAVVQVKRKVSLPLDSSLLLALKASIVNTCISTPYAQKGRQVNGPCCRWEDCSRKVFSVTGD